MKIEQDKLSLAVYSLQRTGFRYGMYAFITGCDDFSCALGALLKHSGAAGVTMGAMNSEEATKIEKLGFTSYVYGSDNMDKTKKLTDGRLFDLVYETTGNATAYGSFIDMLKRGGAVGVLARLDEPYTFFVKTAVRSQIRFVGMKSFDEKSAKIAKALLATGWRGLA